jgi:hypothetical protein
MNEIDDQMKSAILNLPGRQLIPLRMVGNIIKCYSTRDIRNKLKSLFGEEWEEILGKKNFSPKNSKTFIDRNSGAVAVIIHLKSSDHVCHEPT